MVRCRRTLPPAVAALAATGALAAPAAATPPGTNGMIVWQQETRRTPPDLWVANADGSAARRVFVSPAFDFEGTFSPVTATQMAFTRGRDAPFSERLFIGDLTTGAARQLVRGRAAQVAPTFSADGSRIVYFEVPPPRSEQELPKARVYVVNADGTGRRAVTPRRFDAVDPDFSPDGRRIVYTENRVLGGDNVQSRLAVIRVDGRGHRALTRYGGGNENNAKWMPDGRRIVFETIRADGRDSTIETIAAGGRDRRRLLATSAFETNPVPSPDGTRIVFTSDRDRPGRERFNNGLEVYTMAADGSDIVRVTNNRRADRWPDWQRLP